MTRVIFFGMAGIFSRIPLANLVTAGVDISAVIVPCPSPTTTALPRQLKLKVDSVSDLPLLDPYLDLNIFHIAWSHNIPIWEVGRLANAATLDLLTAMRPDLICVSCFPYIFPRALLQLPKYGCLNLHPSLLPAYRGPAPLFWQARQAEGRTGVTLHFLDEGIDSGDIVAQTSFDWSEDLSGADVERRCAMEGARLMVEAIQQLEHGPLPRQAQPQAGSSYFPWPSAEDFCIPTHWPARRAFNFIQAAEDWPLAIEVEGCHFDIRVAIDYNTNQKLNQPYILNKDELQVQFQPGVLRVEI